MTNEEAIQLIDEIASSYYPCDKKDALEMSILALEQEPCKDAISREQAVDAVADLFEMSEYPHPYPQGKPIRLKDIKEKLKQLPPVQPKTEIKPIGYRECSDAMLKMWMDNVLTDGEYYRIMDKLNAKWSKMNEVKS